MFYQKVIAALVKERSVESRSVANVLQERSVVLSARHRVHCSPAILTVVLETGHTPTEKGSRFPVTLDTATLVTDLVLQHVRFDLNLLGTNAKQTRNSRVVSVAKINKNAAQSSLNCNLWARHGVLLGTNRHHFSISGDNSQTQEWPRHSCVLHALHNKCPQAKLQLLSYNTTGSITAHYVLCINTYYDSHRHQTMNCIAHQLTDRQTDIHNICVHNHIRRNGITYLLVQTAVVELHEPAGDSGNVARVRGEHNTSSTWSSQQEDQNVTLNNSTLILHTIVIYICFVFLGMMNAPVNGAPGPISKHSKP